MNLDIQALVTATKSKPEVGVEDVLAKLSECLGKQSLQAEEELEMFKQDLFNHGILDYCARALTLNFTNSYGGYKTAVQIADILSACCVGIGRVKKSKAFHKFLPVVVKNLFSLADSLMMKALRDKSEIERARMFRKIMGSISWLLRAHHHLLTHVLNSKHYENIQLSEDEDVAVALLSLWLDLLGMKSSKVFEDIGVPALLAIMDDTVYKMSCFQNPVIGRSSVKILMHIMNHDSKMIQVAVKRYHGLAALAVKDWRGKGFDPVLDRFVSLLKSPPFRRTSTKGKDAAAEQERAACVIQAAWRAHQTRKRLKKLPRAVTRLQRSFRERKRKEEEQQERKRAEEELRMHMQLRRQRANRLFRQRQLQLMEILPAAQVERYLGEVERQAALLIQRVWRGHRERRLLQQRRYQLRRHRAAVAIQRAVLRFLERRRAHRAHATPWMGLRKPSDTRRAQLQQEVDDHLALYCSRGVSEEHCRELHTSTQRQLRQWLSSREAAQGEEQHTQALLAQINTHMELLLNAPSLKESTPQDCERFRSRSGPVSLRAKQCHGAMVQSASLPWWRKLTEESTHADLFCIHGDDDDFGQVDLEVARLYLGGTREDAAALK
ncbi:IQ calmodulin-binding motif-containing protein 1 [Sardina pilchardus]|uniref:IQ calmodulin-binding motif-containing protein 1 n=1 Tax=Sardina pilchardus TaxID=27697 RepID=UPI002E143EA0